MGVLSAGAATGNDTPNTVETDDTPVAESAEPAAAPESEKPTFVPFSAVEPRKPGSRREKAQREVEELIDSRLKPMRETWDRDRQTYQQQLQQAQQESAQLRGQLEAMQRMPQQAPQQQGPDPAKLTEEAIAALDKQDLATYHRKLQEAADARADRVAETKMQAMRKDLEARIPQQLPPMIQGLLARHHNVAMAGDRGAQAVMLKEQELGLYGMPQGQERTAKAFELADKFLESLKGGQPQRPTYSQESAQVLAAVPTQRPAATNGGGREAGHELTQLEKDTAKAAGMTAEDYVRWKYPDRFLRR